MSRIRIWILFLAASCGACAGRKRAEIADSVWPTPVDFPNAQYLEVGWGDMDYYLTPDPHQGLIFKAALLPTASVLHIIGFSGPVPAYFPYSEIIRIELSSAGFEHLSHTIAESFARDEAGNTTSLGLGLYGNSRFYLSRERYHLFNTCNVWVARVLRTAGLPTTPAWAISVENLMSQARKFGMVVQSRPEPSA